MRAASGSLLLLALLFVTTNACGAGNQDPRCIARQALRDAVRAVDQAESAESAGDADRVRQQIDQAGRLIRLARGTLSRSSTSSIDRSMLEAAEYLGFIVDDYRASGAVDGTLAQFASRELNRAPSPGEAPLNC